MAELKDQKRYFQVAYKLESPETIEREFHPLLAIDDHFPKYVITMDEFFKDSIRGVKHLHISEFLLAIDW